MPGNVSSKESLLFTVKRLQSKDVLGAVAVHSSAYIAAYAAIDEATQGKITAFVCESDFILRKISYYKGFANDGRGSRIARFSGSRGLNSILGVCTVVQDTVDTTLVHVDGIFVEPEHAGRGIGSALLMSALKDFPDWQTMRTTTTYGTRAVDFFTNEGFKQTSVDEPWPLQPYEWGDLLLLQVEMEVGRKAYFETANNR